MTQRQMSVRIGMEGKADITRDFDDVATSAENAYGRIGKAVDDGTGAIQRQKEAQDKLTESQARTDVARANQGAFNQVLGVHAPQTGQAQASASAFSSAFSGMEQRAAALREQIDPLGAAQGRMNTAIADASMLLKSGMISETEHTAAVKLARTAYDDTAKSLKAMAEGEGVSLTKTTELAKGLAHLADGAATGHLSMRQITATIKDFARASEGEGGLGGLLGSLFANPYVDIGLAVAASATALALAYSRAEDAEHKLAEATEFAGRAVGSTKDQIEAFAETTAKADTVSVASARDIEVAFAKTGAVTGQQLSDLTTLTVEFYRKTPASMDEARATMVKAFADPAKAGEQLLASLGALDDKTRQTIDTMVAQGNITQAQDVLEQALTQTLKEATNQTTWYGDAWAWVKRQASDAIETLSHGVAPSTTGALLTAKQAQLQGIIDSMHQHGASDDTVNSAYQVVALRAEIGRLQTQLGVEQKQAGTDAASQVASKLSLTAAPLARQALPGYTEFRTLEADQDVVNRLAANSDALKHSGLTLAQVKEAQDAYNRAVASYIDPATKAQKLTNLDIQATNAKTVAQKVSIAEQRTAVELAGQVITQGEAEQRIKAAGAKVYAEATAQLNAHAVAYIQLAEAYLKGETAGQMAELGTQKREEAIGKAMVQGARQVAQMDSNAAAQKRLNDAVAAGTMTTLQARQAMEQQNALAPLVIAQALAEGKAKDELTKIIERMTKARQADTAEQTRAKAQQEVESGNHNIALLQDELKIANDNESVRQVELAVLQKKSQLLEQGIDLESAEGRQILANTETATRLQQQLDLAKSSRGEVEGMFDSVSSKFASFITSGKYDWQSFSKVAISALQDIENEIFKLAVTNPLKNAIFGENLPTLDSTGSALGGLFGKGSADPESVSVTGVKGSWSDSSSSGGWMSDLGSWFAGLFHEGGVVGESGNDNRAVPGNVFRFAPRFHSGAVLGPDEVPAILQTGERVLNRAETRAYGSGGGMTFAPGAIVIQTQNPQSFQQSKGQVAASLAQMVRTGARRL